MKGRRLWPVLIVLALALGLVIAMERAGRDQGAHYETILVAGGAGGSEGGGEDDTAGEEAWQATDPTSTEHARARQLMRRGELDAALDLYEIVTNIDVPPVPLLTEYAYAMRRAHRCDEAAELTARALARAPEDGGVNFAHALTHRCLGDESEALEAFERALVARPNHSPSRIAYGEYLRRTGDLDAAVRILEPAAHFGSNDERARALAQLGRCLFERGNRSHAREVLAEAIERAPASVDIWMSVARTYLLSDNEEDQRTAFEHAKRASRLAPELATPHSVLGRVHEKLGQRLEAIVAYERAAQLDPEYVYIRTRLVRLGLEEEEFEIAGRAASELLEIDPSQAEYHFLHGLVAARNRQYDAAEASYREAIRVREGEYAEAWYNLGILHRETGALEEAMVAYDRALQLRSDYEAAWNNLGLVYFDLEAYEEAEIAFHSAIELRDDYAAAWSNLGRLYSTLDDYTPAADAYERALELDPDNRIVRLRLAVAYRRTGRTARSIAVYESLVRDEPRYVSAWYNLGIALAASGRSDAARNAYLSALIVDPGHRSSLVNLGRLEARMGLVDEAMAHLTDALDRDQTDVSVRLEIAELSVARGDTERCAREAQRVLAQVPAHSVATALAARCGAARRTP